MNYCLRPEYVSEFVCDGVRCPNNCCKRHWQIEIDAATYHKYELLEPQAEAQALTSLFIRDDKKNLYRLKKRPCPCSHPKAYAICNWLTEKISCLPSARPTRA